MKTLEMTKEDLVSREVRRLKRVFKSLDANKLATVDSLIKNVAFMSVSIAELQGIINRDGYIAEFSNGGGQQGTKQTDAVKIYLAMTRNHAAAVKILCDMVPAAERKDSKLLAMMRDE